MYVFVKGADSSLKRWFSSDATWVDEEVERFAEEGLRTLVFGYKQVDEANIRWDLEQLKDTDVECDLIPLGITAVEDLLQERVRECITDFKAAGINVWMLTGDKGLTAKMIGIQCGLISHEAMKHGSKTEVLIELQPVTDAELILKEISDTKTKIKDYTKF